MFTVYHFIWLGICLTILCVSLIYIHKKQISVNQLLPVCSFFCIASELAKTFSVIKMVPSADGSMYYPYLELQFLPFHLCSILMFLIVYCTFTKNEQRKNTLLGFLYATGMLGGIMALAMPSVYSSVSPSQSFTSPLVYQTFLYHTMLIILSVTILREKNSVLTPRHFKTTLLLAGVMAFFSIYLNSLFATAVYEDSVLKSVEYTTNFFFTYRTPIGITLTTKGQWFLYLSIITVLGVALIYLLYIPVFRRAKRQKAAQAQEKA